MRYANATRPSQPTHEAHSLGIEKSLKGQSSILESAHIVVRRDLSHTLLHVEYDFADDKREVISDLLDHLAASGRVLQAKVKTHAS
jgi:hypothetical protein